MLTATPVPRPDNSGFTLIEVLVSIVILSIGLLGLAGLQAKALRATQSSSFMSVAAQRANDISDRIRANYNGFRNNAYYDIWGSRGSPPADQKCYDVMIGGSGPCDSNKMALDDASAWQTGNALWLPNGFGVVCRDDSPDDGTPGAPACGGAADSRVVIKIWWDEAGRAGDSRSGAGSGVDRFVTVFQP